MARELTAGGSLGAQTGRLHVKAFALPRSARRCCGAPTRPAQGVCGICICLCASGATEESGRRGGRRRKTMQCFRSRGSKLALLAGQWFRLRHLHVKG